MLPDHHYGTEAVIGMFNVDVFYIIVFCECLNFFNCLFNTASYHHKSCVEILSLQLCVWCAVGFASGIRVLSS
jgi:hypothetical protein